jgi:amidase
VVVRDFGRARARARAADAAAAAGAWWGPLHGLPMTVKDNLDVGGLPTSKGDPLLAELEVGESEEAVARLQAAGAIILGKTNLPLQANDVQSGAADPRRGARTDRALDPLTRAIP